MIWIGACAMIRQKTFSGMAGWDGGGRELHVAGVEIQVSHNICF
jgi:hypothetical protein